jgi:hypothetical protein
MNGIVARAAQDIPAPSTTHQRAPAAEPPRPPAEVALDAAGAPERYQDQFFAVLQELVASGPMDSKQPRRLFGHRTDVMARLLTLSRRVEDGGNPALYRQAYLAAWLWKTHPSTGSTVSAVIDDIEFASSRNSPIYIVMYGLIASLLWLSLGALAFLTLSSFVYAWSSGSPWQAVISGPYFRLLTSPVMVASIFGMLGAVVSVLLRLSEFEYARRRSRQFLRMTGVVLPLVGVVFASVTCALFTSGLINFSFAVGSERTPLLDNTYFFIVIGFLSGFSERFTRGLLGSTEQSLMTTRSEAQTTLRTEDGATLNKVTQSTNIITQQAPPA